MPILRKLKSLLGRDEPSETDRDVTVTVEHDPETEAAVKGTDHADLDESAGADATDEAADEGDVEGDVEGDIEAVEGDEDEGGADEAGEAEVESTEDVVTEAEPAEESAGASEPVDVLNGVGPAYAGRLEDAGVETVADLASADPADLAAESDIAEGRLQGWIEQAREY